jgi:hypothetical protein
MPTLTSMPTERMTLGEWRRKLGDSVPLAMAPLILGVEPAQIRQAMAQGLLTMHTFRVEGKAYHRVRTADLRRFKALGDRPTRLRDLLLTRPASAPRPADIASAHASPLATRRVLVPPAPVQVEDPTRA